MPPEKSAYALARYSRSPDSIRDSIAWVRSHDSRKFLESFYFQYGHASIADLGHAVLCFEGISELAATEMEEEPLWDGQAKSSRYQDFSRSGFITPPELEGEEAAAYRAAGEALLEAYAQVNRAGLRAPERETAASRGHEARGLPAQPGGAGVRRGALPALLGRAHQRGPGGQHPHARKADPALQGVRVPGAAGTGRRNGPGLRGRARLPVGRGGRRGAARAHAGPPRRPRRTRRAIAPRSASVGPGRTCPRRGAAWRPWWIC